MNKAVLLSVGIALAMMAYSLYNPEKLIKAKNYLLNKDNPWPLYLSALVVICYINWIFY